MSYFFEVTIIIKIGFSFHMTIGAKIGLILCRIRLQQKFLLNVTLISFFPFRLHSNVLPHPSISISHSDNPFNIHILSYIQYLFSNILYYLIKNTKDVLSEEIVMIFQGVVSRGARNHIKLRSRKRSVINPRENHIQMALPIEFGFTNIEGF